MVGTGNPGIGGRVLKVLTPSSIVLIGIRPGMGMGGNAAVVFGTGDATLIWFREGLRSPCWNGLETDGALTPINKKR